MRQFLISFIILFSIITCFPVMGSSTGSIKIGSYIFGSLRARAIGPAVMGGRISSLAVVDKDPNIIFVGAAGGGLWKSINAGATFEPVFDKYTQSIGALCIDQSKPEIIWVGTGEPWVRNSVSVGTGLYKSSDSGDNWKLVGLKDSERISDILINPRNSKEVYVAVLGHLWNANPERGVYKTTDSGKTWQKILYVNENTGCADLAMDPQEPGILYAAMWQFRRQPYFFNSGGPGSGLFRSRDSGKTWQKIHRGLPKGNLGRIAVAVAPSRTSTVYCTVEAKKNALYRSDDRGETWLKVSTHEGVTGRPFYFSLLKVDPNDYKRVYKPGFILSVSTDSGESFETRYGGAHVDFHALWINPANSRHMLLGTDGGLYVSYNRGSNWRYLNNLPISQFYHVSYDMEQPYNVYGGLQDNGSWMAPSRSPRGIKNSDWVMVGYGDGFYVWVDPSDKNLIYREYQGGKISRYHRSTGESKDIVPLPEQGEPDFRFNWNAPIAVTKNAIYMGAQFLLRSVDKGDSWMRISSDLTTNDPAKQRQEMSGGLTIDNTAAENHCSIYTIGISPVDEKVIWAGTDDGNIQLTTDLGKKWQNVVANIPGLPQNTWCSFIEPSPFDKATAFAVFDGHRTGDMKVYLYRTTDFGKSWKSLATETLRGYAHVIRQDLVNSNLLFLGTEFGLFISINGGEQWVQFTGNLANVSVRDIALHPRDSDVILATHGRGIYILDNITLIRKITNDILTKKVHLFEPATVEIKTRKGDYRLIEPGEFVGANPSEVAQVAYFLKKRHLFGDLKVEVYDAENKLVKTLSGGKRRGLNVVNWYMRLKPPEVSRAKTLAGYALFGPMAPEGVYKIKLIKGKDTFSSTIKVTFAADYPHPAADRKLQQDTVWKLYRMQEKLAQITKSIVTASDQVKKAIKKQRSGNKRLQQFLNKLEGLHKKLVATREDQGITGEQQLREKVVELYGMVNNFGGKPTDSQLSRQKVLDREIINADRAFNNILNKDLKRVNNILKKRKVTEIYFKKVTK